jgi:hypothetical protein
MGGWVGGWMDGWMDGQVPALNIISKFGIEFYHRMKSRDM